MEPYSKEFRGEVLAACERGRAGTQGRASAGQRAAWSREDHDLPCGPSRNGPDDPLVVSGAIDGKLFLGWVRHHLVPTLRPGDVVVGDNLGARKVRGIRKAISAAGGRVIHLPPYSPDLNPIELVLSTFKWLLKGASAGAVGALWSVCGHVLARFTEPECRNCFQHCGSRST